MRWRDRVEEHMYHRSVGRERGLEQGKRECLDMVETPLPGSSPQGQL